MTTEAPGMFDDLLVAADAARRRLYAEQDDTTRQPSARQKREATLLDAVLQRALAACEPGSQSHGRSRECSACLKLQEVEPLRPAAQCASWVWDGMRYWAAICSDCDDLAWSRRWKQKREAARSSGDGAALSAIDAARERRLKAGRRVYA